MQTKCPDCNGKKDKRAQHCFSCSYKYRSGENNSFYKHGKYTTCVDCGKTILYGRKNKRCYQCWLLYRKKIAKTKVSPLYKGGRAKHKCLDCDTLIQMHNERCKKCWGKFKSNSQLGVNNPAYIHGLSKKPYPSIFNRQLKDRVRVRDNFQCRICGVPELELNRKLSVHHIDYNKDNQSMDNLIAVCLTCHNKTNRKKERKVWQKKLQLISR
jgi:hypothetical protein